MAILATACLLSLLPQGPSMRAPAPPPAEVVLAASADPVPLAEFGLGDGGIGREREQLRWSGGDCITPGGVRIECRHAGVKLTFPSGRELLVAADGHLHLRSGEVAGPFASGLELRLGDGASVRITLSQGVRERLRDVIVQEGDLALQPWRRGEAARWVERTSIWSGLRFACCGDGGDVYRTIALGPLIVLDRVLVAQDRSDVAPTERLVVLTHPMLQSLEVMQRQHRQPDAAVRQAMATVAAVADRGDSIFPAGASLPRIQKDTLRWQLGDGCELELDLDGPQSPRLSLFAPHQSRPLVEWTLHADAAAFLTNPREDQMEKRWHANGTRLPKVAADLQVRQHLFERGYALRVIDRFRR
jgi:hypothetical protein